MALWTSSPGVTPDPALDPSSPGGCTVNLSLALAKALQLFKEGALEHLRRQRKDIVAKDIVWAVTVPAIWEVRPSGQFGSAQDTVVSHSGAPTSPSLSRMARRI